MTNAVEKEIFLSIPLPSSESATLVYEVLNVDKELKGCGVKRNLSTDGSNLVITFQGDDLKKLRVSLNSVFKNIILVIKTLDLYGNI